MTVDAAPPPAVLGVDLSLSATGLAYPTGGRTTVRPTSTGTERLRKIRSSVMAATTGVDLVVVEGPAFGRVNQMHALGQLAGVIYVALDEAGVRWMLVPPANLKRYATGKGNATKAEVLAEAIRRLGYPGADYDESDATWLRAIGLALLGHPVVDLPATHRKALDALSLPSRPAVAS